MGLIRSIAVLSLAFTSLAAFARGVLRDTSDFWTNEKDGGRRAKSVLEKGYAPPEKIEDKKVAGSDDADLLLGLMADVAGADAAVVTNAPTVGGMAGKAAVVEPPVVAERVVEVEKPVFVERTNVVEKVIERSVEVEKVVTNTIEVVRVEKVEVERPVTNVIERVVERPVEVEKVVTVERPVTNVVERIVEVERPVEKIVERPVTNVVEKVVEIERPVVVERQVTSVVEKVVYDRSVEARLARDKENLERRGGELEAQKEALEKRNSELQRELEAERGRLGRLERTNPGAEKKAKTGRPARITSKTTYYDRKRGVALFEGKVHVDDESYQLHADKAYVFTVGSNDVRRIVAVGGVAMTNEMRRAYGDKVSYYRQNGMVVLYAGNGIDAEIRDESKAEDQTVRGSRIKFWIGSEQVEVLDATIVAPKDGAGLDMKSLAL